MRGADSPDRRIDYLHTLDERSAGRVVAHEFGHAIDEIAGEIPTEGLNTEVRRLYNTLNTGQERTRNLTGPGAFRYGAEDIPREYMAEAIRAYMADPNSMKTVAPNTAARIRKHVNNNPRLNRFIQFNTLAPFGAAGAAAMLATPESDRD